MLTPAASSPAIGFRVAIFPAAGFLAATEALSRVYRALRDHGSSGAADTTLHPFGDFNELMGFREVIAFSRTVSEGP